MIAAALNVLGSGLKGFFTLKETKAETINKALDIVSDVNKTEESRILAASSTIIAEAKSESWIASSWRPLTVLSFVGILNAYLWGVGPVDLSPEMLNRLFNFVETCVLGYGAARTGEKLIKEVGVSQVIKRFRS